MAGASLRFPPWQAKIVLRAGEPQLDDTKTAPHEVGVSERRENADQRLVIRACHLNVEILRLQSEQPVAHSAADDPRAPDGAQARKIPSS